MSHLGTNCLQPHMNRLRFAIPQVAKSAAARRCSQGSLLPVRLSGEASSRRRLPQFENLASGAVNTPPISRRD